MSTNSFEVKNGSIFIADRRLDLPYSIGQVVKFNDIIIARLEPPAGVIFNRNVFAFTAQGDLLWQIEESPHGTEEDKPYVGIFLSQDGSLIAANWIGVDYLVNVQSGRITAKAFNK